MTRSCNRCDETHNIRDFEFLGREDGFDSELLCWEHRWPYIEERVQVEPEDEKTSGQQTLGV